MAPRPTFTRWETPVSDARSLALVSLSDEGGALRITLQDLRDPECRRFTLTVGQPPAYRNIMEEYRSSEDAGGRGLGWTRVSDDSEWLAKLRNTERLLDVYEPGCRHYRITTKDDVIDVLSNVEPTFTEVEPASADEPVPGKSTILHHPDDEDRLNAWLAGESLPE